jgi:hypothetical protein
LYAAFERRVNGLRRARAAGDRALNATSLRSRELALIYEATFLNLVITFEAFQESLFYSSLLGDVGMATVRPLIQFRHRAEAERFVQATERTPFLSWSKTRESLERARRFLAGGRPFTRLERRDRDASVLKTAVIVRNAIAHQSGVAREEFARLAGAGMAGPNRRPADYLRKVVGTETQHEVLCRDILRIAKALGAQTDASARQYLLPERPYRSGEEERGSFRCTTCGQMLQLAIRQKLPNCSACNQLPCPVCGNVRKSEFVRV